MPRGGANHIITHTCPDGVVRRIEAVYFREESSKTGKGSPIRLTSSETPTLAEAISSSSDGV